MWSTVLDYYRLTPLHKVIRGILQHSMHAGGDEWPMACKALLPTVMEDGYEGRMCLPSFLKTRIFYFPLSEICHYFLHYCYYLSITASKTITSHDRNTTSLIIALISEIMVLCSLREMFWYSLKVFRLQLKKMK